MAGVDRDLAQLRHDAIDAEGLVAQLAGIHHGVDRLGYGPLRPDIAQKRR